MLTKRQTAIFKTIVDEFTRTAEPVGSKKLMDLLDFNCSSATIRNEMADLEEMGYLIQPHVSAGRVPSDKAYRLYVDALLTPGLREDERESVRRYFTSRVHDMEDVISLCAQTLSDLTHYTALVLTPRQSDLRVSSLHLVSVARGSALLIVVTDSGVIRDTTIRVSEKLDSDGLYAISKMLTERLRGLSLRQMREMLYGFAAHSDADARVLSGIAELAGQMEKQTETDRVMVGGAHNILYYPEYADVCRARAFMDALQNRDALITLMRPPQSPVSVRIGGETGIPELSDCSVITAPYRVGRGHMGSIGVVGPMRMNYARVMDTLTLVSRELTGMLSVDALEA